ncbi:large ribosomal subunit protein mL55-like [Rhopilema esculentum]|uniref:large ribosomal subunit protein mL55-like n=1 Tax=Rhopilema esculentum TaxID=499914 RepID=UPI0031CFD134|eukprot:gene4861-21189_t
MSWLAALSKSANGIPNCIATYSKVMKQSACLQFSRLNSTSITRIRKKTYARMYKVRIVNPDGSSYFVRHPEPIGVIRMPQDPNLLTEEEKKSRLRRLKGEKIVDVASDFEKDDVKFDQRAVTRLLRKKKA